MTAKNMTEQAEQFLHFARKAGADAADALAVAGQSVRVNVLNAAVENIERSESTDFGLRVFVNGSTAIVSGTADTSHDFETLAERAVAMAKAAPPDPSAALLDTSGNVRQPASLELFDPTNVSVEQLQTLAMEAEAAAREVKGVTKSDLTSASAGKREIAVVTTNGFCGHYQRTGFTISASAVAGEGTTMERESDYCSRVQFEDLDSPASIGRKAGERAVRALNPRKMKSQKCPIVFEARLASSFASLLASAVNGSGVVRGTSFLKEKLGQQVFAPGITITDDPLLVRGVMSRPFDVEGMMCAAFNLVEDGVLTNWLLDGRTAKKLGLVSNARATRSTGGQPSPSSTNLWLTNGTASPEDMIGSIKSGLLVTSMFTSGVNMITGDYSRGCAGIRIENGELTHPVSEITMAGNLSDMFAKLTPANDLKIKDGSNAPTCLVEGMTIAGA